MASSPPRCYIPDRIGVGSKSRARPRFSKDPLHRDGLEVGHAPFNHIKQEEVACFSPAHHLRVCASVVTIPSSGFFLSLARRTTRSAIGAFNFPIYQFPRPRVHSPSSHRIATRQPKPHPLRPPAAMVSANHTMDRVPSVWDPGLLQKRKEKKKQEASGSAETTRNRYAVSFPVSRREGKYVMGMPTRSRPFKTGFLCATQLPDTPSQMKRCISDRGSQGTPRVTNHLLGRGFDEGSQPRRATTGRHTAFFHPPCR